MGEINCKFGLFAKKKEIPIGGLLFLIIFVRTHYLSNSTMKEENPNRRHMKVNVNHPSFISFLENISENILSAIKIDEYFNLTSAKKLKVSYTVLNLLKNSAKVKANLSDAELKSFIAVLCKKNEEIENYEFAAVLNDVVKNFDVISKAPPKKPAARKKKTTTKPPAAPQGSDSENPQQ